MTGEPLITFGRVNTIISISIGMLISIILTSIGIPYLFEALLGICTIGLGIVVYFKWLERGDI